MICIVFSDFVRFAIGLIGRNIGTSRVTYNNVSKLPRFLHRTFLSRTQLHSSNTSSNISRRIQVGFRWKSSDTLPGISEENWRHCSVYPIRLLNSHNAGTLQYCDGAVPRKPRDYKQYHVRSSPQSPVWCRANGSTMVEWCRTNMGDKPKAKGNKWCLILAWVQH